MRSTIGTATSNEPGRGALNHWRRGRDPVTGRAFLNQLNALFNRVQYDGALHNFVAILLCGAYIKRVRGFQLRHRVSAPTFRRNNEQ